MTLEVTFKGVLHSLQFSFLLEVKKRVETRIAVEKVLSIEADNCYQHKEGKPTKWLDPSGPPTPPKEKYQIFPLVHPTFPG